MRSSLNEWGGFFAKDRKKQTTGAQREKQMIVVVVVDWYPEQMLGAGKPRPACESHSKSTIPLSPRINAASISS